MFFTLSPAEMNTVVIADCRGFRLQGLFMSYCWPCVLFHMDCSLFPSPGLQEECFHYLPRLVCQSFCPWPKFRMLWVLLEEWLPSYRATSLWGLYTSTLRIPSGKDWIWYPGPYLGNRLLSICLHCFAAPPTLLKCVCVLLIQAISVGFLFQQCFYFPSFPLVGLWFMHRNGGQKWW